MDWDRVSSLLDQEYHSPRHGNPCDPTDSLFYIMLTRKTPISKAQRVFAGLRLRDEDWTTFYGVNGVDRLAMALRGIGLEKVRANQMIQTAISIKNQLGSVSLEALRCYSDQECFDFLVSLPGVGAKTAYCVMLYGLQRDVFPADAHCIRCLGRMGVTSTLRNHRAAQRQLAQVVPGRLAYVLHVNMVAHGQAVCKACRPDCQKCVIRSHCGYGLAHDSAGV